MVTLNLSRVDKKAYGPLKLVSYWSLLVPLQATHLSPIGKAQKPAQLDNWLDTKGKNVQNIWMRNIILKWCVREWKSLSNSPFCYQLRDHTSWASRGIGVKIESLPKNIWSSVLNFTTSRYAFLFSNSETYIVHVINYEWNWFVIFHCAHVFFQQVHARLSHPKDFDYTWEWLSISLVF